MAACQLGAFKNAIERLREYDTDIIPKVKNRLLPLVSCDKLFPYPTRFASLLAPQDACEFQYTSRLDEKLVFFGELPDHTGVCLKFVRRYSLAAHRHMAVMDRVDGEYVDLFNTPYDPSYKALRPDQPELHHALRNALAGLHAVDLVHGDIRSINIAVAKNREPKFMLLGFRPGRLERCGTSRIVHVGPDLWRPAEVYDGVVITPEHDMQMLVTEQLPPGIAIE